MKSSKYLLKLLVLSFSQYIYLKKKHILYEKWVDTGGKLKILLKNILIFISIFLNYIFKWYLNLSILKFYSLMRIFFLLLLNIKIK